MKTCNRMTPNPNIFSMPIPMEPISRTYQYRKIMKPMLERKRRARINKCLDELKTIMSSTMEMEGENMSKLEKADILELTVRHLSSLHRKHNQKKMDFFWEGFRQCASEVSQYLSKFDQKVCSDLINYINSCTQPVAIQTPAISIRSDAYLYGNNQSQCSVPNKGVHFSQDSNYAGASSKPAENIEVANKVWRPW